MRIFFTYLSTRTICAIVSCFVLSTSFAQNNCVPVVPNSAPPQNLSLGCGANCTTLSLSVPHLKQTSDYAIQTIPYTPQPYVSATGTELTFLYADDKYSPLINLPFSFCFYDSSYNTVVVGSNGLITFDQANQSIGAPGCSNAFGLDIGQPIPQVQSVGPCGFIFDPYYPRASIMGVFQDIDPSITLNHADRRIEYRIEGTAPCRKLIVSFNNMSMYSCDDDTSTSQIIVQEGTGIIEIYVKQKTICTTWNDGLGILGIQNWYGTKAKSPAGMNDEQFALSNAGFRFLPSGGVTRFVKSELLLNNVVVAAGDTSTAVANELFINFPNVCPATITSQYVIRTEFRNCTDPNNPLTRYDTINITKTAALPGTAVSTSTTCGGSTGTITVTADAGVAPFTFTLTGPGGPYAPQVSATNTTTFNNLPTGNFTINITDAAACTGSTTANVGNLLNLTSTFTSTPATCPGVNNGSLSVTPDIGAAAGPYTFTVTGPGGPYTQTGVASTATFTNLAGGTYSVTFTNAAACSGTVASIVVGPGTAPTASIVKNNNTSCVGASDAVITVTPAGGAAQGPYNITLNGPGGPYVQTGVATSAVFNGLPLGTFSANFTNAAGCAGTTSTVTVFNGTTPTATITGGFTSCSGASDGNITVTPNAGAAQGPYDITLNGTGGPYIQNGVATSAVFPGLPIGSYTATFTNAAGCTGTTIAAAISNGPAVTGSFLWTNTNCPGVNDGTVTITPNGGVAQGPYSITLTGTGGPYTQTGVATAAVFPGLASGIYNATFTNAAGCSGNVGPVTVSPGPALTGTAVATNTSCPTRNDGTITVTASGTGPFVYTLNPGNIVQPNNPLFINLAPNTYTITFTTASGCSGFVSPDPVVGPGPFLTSTFTQFDPPCYNINNGTITIVPGGVAPHTFVLTGPGGPYTQTNPVFSNLGTGAYAYSFTDANGCTGTSSVGILLTTHLPLATTVSLTQPLCNGNANAVITLNASGGLQPYEYALSPFATYQSTGIFNSLTAGTYTFRIRDNAGCTKDTTVTLGEPTLLTASATSPTPAGCSGNDGTIVVTGNGGVSPYAYSIDGVNYQPGNSFVAPAVGPYPNIKVRDANGCIANASTTVGLVDNMFLTLGPDTTICVGSSVKFQPMTNPGTSVYNWRPLDPLVTPASTIDTANIKNAAVTPADTAIYILHAEWGACVREDTIIVNVLHKPVANAGLDTAICNQTFAILRGSATNLSGPVNYSWSPAGSVQNPLNAVTIATPGSNSQFYTLTVTDNYGCNFSVTDQVLVTVQPPVPAFAGNDTIAVKGVPHQLFGSGGADYLWSPAAPLNLSTAQNPLATLNDDQLFTLKVTDVAGCIGYANVFIKVYVGPNYYIPNAFSPNGDGENDIFRAIPPGIVTTQYFRVFNRYGQLMFETNQWLKGWDGKYRGKAQPMGAYVWVIKGIDKNGKTIELKGTVMLIQ